MREPKFRGKGIIHNAWIYGGLAVDRKDNTVILPKADWSKGGCVYQETVGQYTGLRDKNNVEVYEGDILHAKAFKNLASSYEESELFDIEDLKGELKADYIDKVVFEDGSFSFGSYYLDGFFGDQRHSFPIHEIEVVGNIYDNKEMLDNIKNW